MTVKAFFKPQLSKNMNAEDNEREDLLECARELCDKHGDENTFWDMFAPDKAGPLRDFYLGLSKKDHDLLETAAEIECILGG